MQKTKTDLFLRKFVNSNWILGFLSLFLFASTYIISLYNTSSLSNNWEQKQLQSALDELLHDMDDIVQTQKMTPADYNFFALDFQQKINDKHIKAFVYQNDSLIAWTDNDYLISRKISGNQTYVETTANAYVLVRDYVMSNFSFRLTFPLLSRYKIENEYLNNTLNPQLGIDGEIEVSTSADNGTNYYSPEGQFLFSGLWQAKNTISNRTYATMLGFYFLAIALLLAFTSRILQAHFPNKNKVLLLRQLAILLVMFILQWLRLPSLLYNSEVFSAQVFASSPLFNSLGSIVIYSMGALFMLTALLEWLAMIPLKIKNKNIYNFIFLSYLVLLFFLLLLLKSQVANLIFNSTISFDITQISSINYLSIVGLLALGIWVFAFFLLFKSGQRILLEQHSLPKPWLGLILFLSVGFWWISFTGANSFPEIAFISLLALFSLLIKQKSALRIASLNTLFLFIFSVLLSYWFNNFNLENEHNRRKSIIQGLAQNQDPQAEYLFSEISSRIYEDEKLQSYFQSLNVPYDTISNYIEQQYFRKNSQFDKYDFLITICTSNLKLIIRPQNVEILCDTFFYNSLIQYGVLTQNKNLYRLDYGTGQINYLGLFRFYETVEEGLLPYTVYVEINSKLKRKGFTRLLSQKDYDPFEKIPNYSLATYEANKRVEAYGSFAFPEYYSWPDNNDQDLFFLEKEGYDHLIYRQGKNKIFVLSHELSTNLSKLAPFSYLFILYGILFLLLGNLSNISHFKYRFQLSFAGRLQLTMIPIILVSFAIISSITLYYIQRLNEDKNISQLESLAIALQTEFEHKLNDAEDLTQVDAGYLNSLLIKFSTVFDTDINMFTVEGRLLSTTRPEIFSYPLLSKLMNPSAYNYLVKEHQSLYVAKENIGNLVYSSAYLPFHNSQGQNIAFINLPYFAREEILKTELSNLLMTLMNVYTLIVMLAIFIILFVSNYISRPLIMLKERLRTVTIGKENQRIEWQGIDEIRALVEEYNKMIDALALSSEKLAQSEREMAWREMAKQVAHEIKNPLTPMKLSVQYLMRTFENKDPNWEEKLQSLSKTLIEQIDTLSNIATAFSDFANMPKSMKEKHEINAIIETAVDLYSNHDNVKLTFTSSETFKVNVDKNQWIRVFNNLIKNSIQAMPDDHNLEIEISLERQDSAVQIRFSDNGKGIPEAMQEMIFVPKFTTKTTGAGLGLAMVKNIVTNSEGSIRFESVANKGTTFYIQLPLKD